MASQTISPVPQELLLSNEDDDGDVPGVLTLGPDSVHLGSLGSDDSQRSSSASIDMASDPALRDPLESPAIPTGASTTGQCRYSGHGNTHALEFTFWRRPKLRQWWLKGGHSSLSLTKEHRAATMNDGILDLVFVILLVKMGSVLRTNVITNPTHSESPALFALAAFVLHYLPIQCRALDIAGYLNKWDAVDVIHQAIKAKAKAKEKPCLRFAAEPLATAEPSRAEPRLHRSF